MSKRIVKLIAMTLCLVLVAAPDVSLVAASRAPRKSSNPTTSSSRKSPVRTTRTKHHTPTQNDVDRPGQTTTTLPDGRLLIIGGEDKDAPRSDTFIRDLRTGETIPSASKLRQARAWHSATMLPDGRVLIIGGVGGNGSVVRSAEVFDPQTQSFSLLPESEWAARANHAATLLTNGAVLITGGSVGHGATSSKAVLWDFKSGEFISLSNKLSTARQKHRAILLHDGNVLIEGGNGDDGNRIDAAELYNADAGSFSFSNISADQADLREPLLTGSLPVNGAGDVPVNTFVALRFSKQLRVESINTETLPLTGPEGTVRTKVVPAENGKLAFVTPTEPLLPGVTYTIAVSGIVDLNNQLITSAAVSFTTKGDPETNNPAEDGEEWVPDETNLHGSWRSKFKDSQWRSLPPLQAKPGETALAGQTLMLDGKPLSNVTLRIAGRTALTDNTGRFLLTDIPTGHQVLTIDGRTASRNRRTYGIFRVGVEIKPGKTTALEYTIWMSKLDLARAKDIPSPTSSRTVVTNPRIPGLELILPEGTVIRDTEGQAVTQLSITPIPTNQPPFPLPPGINVPVYFTIQPGGSQIIPPRAQLIYPNFIGSKPGTRINFWNYDPTGKGWYVYGQGTVTANGKQIVPDPGVVLYEFSGAMVGGPDLAPPKGPTDGSEDGDPVDLGTGLLVVGKTDLILPDTIPIALTRTYRPNDTNYSRSFGIGATHPYDIFMVGDTMPYTFQELILPNGGRIRYNRISPGNLWFDAVYEATETPSEFYKSRITYNGGSWDLTLKDGTVLNFPDIFLGASRPNQCGLRGVRDRYGNVLTLTRDANSNLTKITTPNNRWIEFQYDSNFRITQARDNIGRILTYTYDTSGRLWKVKDPNNGVTEYTYDSSHRMLTIKDSRGIVYLTNEYDAEGRVIKQTMADDTPAISDNPTYLFAYTTDSGGRIVQTDVTDPRGNIRRVTFNSEGQSLTDTSALGRPEQQSISLEREAGTNFVRAMIDPLGLRTEYTYDSMGNLSSVTELAGTPSSVTTQMTYEPAFNQLTSVTDPLNHTTAYGYDARGNLVSITDALNHQTTLAYNTAGQVISITDPLQHTTQFIYENGDLIQVKDPLNRTLSFFTDRVGRLLALTDALGRKTRYEYDALSQVKKVTGPSGDVTEMTYDGNGNVLSVKDARNQTTTFTYDNMDQVLTLTDALQGPTSTDRYEYDLGGNLTKLTDRRGKVTTIGYDALDRARFIGFGTTAGPAYESTIDYTHDLYDRITQVVDSNSGIITFNFDDLARSATEITPQGAVGYAYDKAGRLIAKTVTGQEATSYGYDDADRLLNITQGSASVNFTYDDADRRSSLTLPNGLVVDYTYDAASQLTGLAYRNGATLLGDLTYAYDKIGRRIKMGGSLARTALPQPLGSATYNAVNRLTQRGSATLTYDANGNLTNDGTNTYTWDARDQLASIAGSVTASFQYDALGRRVRKTINGLTTDYLYDGDDVVQEKIGGTPSTNLLTGDIDEVFSRTDSTGTQSVLADDLGSTIALLDSSGATQTNYTYEPFGNTSVSGAASSNSSQYTGRENDGTGLYYYRARYYSPKLQRFISEDPIGFDGGDTNLYAYVYNSPTNYSDSSGLAVDTAIDVACIGYDIYTLATGGRKDRLTNLLALGADVAGALIPFATGLGPAVRAARAVKAVRAARRTVKAYEVGHYNKLLKLRRIGKEIHHAPQAHPAKQIIKGYKRRTGPSIALPKAEHRRIPVQKGPCGCSPRDLLAKDIKDLRRHTNAPNKALRELIDLNFESFPGVFVKK